MNTTLDTPTFAPTITPPIPAPSTPAPATPASLTLTATPTRIRTFGGDGDFARIDGTYTDDAGTQKSGILVGELDGATMTAGVAYRFFGRFEHHVKFGLQFKFDSFTPAEQISEAGVVNYLSRSDLGITVPVAKKLWRQYGSGAIETLRRRPESVVADGIVDEATANRAAAKLVAAEASEATKIALFELFAGRGFTKSTVKGAIAQWGDRAVTVIRRNPFALLVAEISGVGFRRTDQLYLDLGGNPLRLKRQTLAAWHWLRTNGTGNTWEIEGGVSKAVLKAAGSVDAAEFEKAITLGIRAKWIAKRIDDEGNAWFAERKNASDEATLAMLVRRFLR